MKLNNRGMTLVEMIVAFAILGIVSASIFSMMLTGTKTYTKLTNTVKLQYSAQLATANMEKRIQNCSGEFSWYDNSLVLVEKTTNAAGEPVDVIEIFAVDDGKLYYGEGSWDVNGNAQADMYLLAEHVESFNVEETTGTSETGTVVKLVKLTLTVKHNGSTHVVEKTISLRNQPFDKQYEVTFTSKTE